MRRLRRLAARRRLGRRPRDATAIAALEAALAGRRHLRRHGRRLRRRPQRAARSAASIAALDDERPFVATKMGRRVPQEHAEYTPARFREWIDRSRENLGVERARPRAAALPADRGDRGRRAVRRPRRARRRRGGSRAYGVSVETCDQALAAIARPHVATVQIILNAFRLKPLERVLPAAARGGRRDHRAGAARERPALGSLRRARRRSLPTTTAPTTATASRSTSARRSPGVDFETGLEAVRRLAPLVPAGVTMAQWALRFVLDQPGVSVVIPGARNAAQARANAARGVAGAAFRRRSRGRAPRLRRADPPVRARALVAALAARVASAVASPSSVRTHPT